MDFKFVCDNIRTLRKSLHLTQKNFGKAINMSNKRISLIETYKLIPTLNDIFAISRAFNISFLDLLEE